jgi:hypothetical protein
VLEPGVDERRARRRWAWAIVAGVGVLLAAVVIGVVVARPDAADGYGPDFERQFTGWCTRSGADEDDAAGPGACRCAYDALAASVPFERLAEVDDHLADDDDLPEDLRSVVAPCLGAG